MRTSLEKMLIFVLIVSVPFLIGIIIVYILIPSYGKESVYCPTFCKQHHVYLKPGDIETDITDIEIGITKQMTYNTTTATLKSRSE